MEKRGGGIVSLEIRETSEHLPDAYQLFVTFNTADAMGANFINSVLEALATGFKSMMETVLPHGSIEIVMAILSNYTPQCLVSCHVECNPSAFDADEQRNERPGICEEIHPGSGDCSEHDPYRAVTHNKGIFNGMDAVSHGHRE